MYLVARYAMYVQNNAQREREAELWTKIHAQETMIQGLVRQHHVNAEVIDQLRHQLVMLRARQDFHEGVFHAPQLTPQITTPDAEPQPVQCPQTEGARWAMIEMD